MSVLSRFSRSPGWMIALLFFGLVATYSGSALLDSARADDGPAVKEDATKTDAPAKDEEAEEAKKEVAPPTAAEEAEYTINNLVLFGAAVLVLFMQAGFAMLEVGFNSAKNTVNILCKNLMDVCVGILLFYAIGFALMYPGTEFAGKYIGFGTPGVSAEKLPEIRGDALNPQVDFFFQAAFAATAATIVSGAVAGRMKFGGYLVYSAVLTGFFYPISGFWTWGGGWLAERGFHDFAGSVIVHAVGGFAGLAGAIILGPRIGRFVKGKSMPMPGHNLTFAALGVFVLWVGWYGFNPGSNLKFHGQANIDATMLVVVNTTLAAAAGAVAAMLVAWVLFKKPDLSMALNGVLAGLVGITANCDCVSNLGAMAIGGIAGVLVVLGIVALDKLKIDDPVGAFPVHGLCGVWGGLATGIFGSIINPETGLETIDMGAQVVGVLAICGWAFATMCGLFYAMKMMGVLRVSAEEEHAGLDLSEHGMHAYPPSQIVDSFPGQPIGASYRQPVGAGASVPSTES